MNVDVALSYLEFVAVRHRIWEARQAGAPQPWTDDPILASRKFTNVFRVLDPGSQFVLTDLPGPDYRVRCFLYRHTGRVEAWKALYADIGNYPTRSNLEDVLGSWKDYRRAGRPLFTGAYLVFPQSQVPGTDKLASIIDLTRRLYDNGSFDVVGSQAERFAGLRRNKGVADFMSMQVLTDWGYAEEDHEDEFIVCGPGAVKGARAIAPTWRPEDVVRWAQPQLQMSVALPDGRLRTPSLMDVQNTLCEFSKYARLTPGKPYTPAHPGPQPAPVFPPLW